MSSLDNQVSSKSQLGQDLFVLSALNNRRDGYYVEFGATDGVSLSNTWYLENEFGWRGILAEPAKCYQEQLVKNRGNDKNHIDFNCVWSKTGDTFDFNEVHVLSTINSFSNCDHHAGIRKGGKLYPVSSISLMDLLAKYNAPKHIDYLSIDTEGSEFEILSAFDFSAYTIDVITCEHNFTPMRGKIYALLTGIGYRRVLTERSQFDDWYVREEVLARHNT